MMNINSLSNSKNNNDNNAIHIELPLRKSSTIPSYLKHACTVALIKHLIFVKKIIPLPPDDILNDYYNELQHNQQQQLQQLQQHNQWQQNLQSDVGRNVQYDTTSFQIYVDDETNPHSIQHNNKTIITTKNNNIIIKKRKRKDITTQLKLFKCGEQLHYLLQDLNEIFENEIDDDDDDVNNNKFSSNNNKDDNKNIKAVVITIGPSFHSPREQYVIRFHSWNHHSLKVGQNVKQTISSQTNVMERLKNEISRRVIREFIKGILESDEIVTNEKQIDHETVNESSTPSSNPTDDVLQQTNNKRLKKSSRLRSKRNIRQNYTNHNSIGNSLSNLKLNVACLVSHDTINTLFHRQHDNTLNNIQLTAAHVSMPPYRHGPRFVIERDFIIKVPRMVSKKHKIYRPFVYIDIRPMLDPITTIQTQVGKYCDESSVGGPKFQLNSGDLWVKLKSTIKGISVRVA